MAFADAFGWTPEQVQALALSVRSKFIDTLNERARKSSEKSPRR